MKKILLTLIVSGLVVANASAISTYSTYSDYNLDGVYLSNGASFTNKFDITQFGQYDPKTEQVYSATAQFLLYDLPFLGGSETLTVSLGGSSFGSSNSFSNFLTIGGNLLGSALFDLNEDGIISYTVTAGPSGGFTLVGSTLKAKVGLAAVPDGGFTLTLLGVALLAIVGAQRKFASAQ